jgi:hypothetical protein
MPTKRKSVSPASQEVYLNDDLPILYVDTCALSTRKGGFNYLSLATNTPNTEKSIVEQVRLIIDDESLRIMLDYLCKGINHFPEKPTKGRKHPSK